LLLQGFVYIKNDGEMVDHETGTASMARNTNLNEDLGKVDYVFSDKTGTLTANEMQLREVAIKGIAYGDASFRSIPLQSAASSSNTCFSLDIILSNKDISDDFTILRLTVPLLTQALQKSCAIAGTISIQQASG